MKRIYLFAAVTAIALTACTKTETTNVSGGNLIRFDNAFVGNPTKAGDLTKANFNKFWVYGSAEGTGDWSEKKFTNAPVNKGEAGIGNNSQWTSEEKAYWTQNSKHFFAAYSNGGSIIDDANLNFNPSESKLTFSNYTAGENDLVAAVATKDAATVGDGTNAGNVALSFKHMLSKVKFTFKTEAAHEQVMTVTNLKFNAVKTTTGDITGPTTPTISWTMPGTSDNYEYDVTALADFAAEEGTFSSEMYAIPQSNESLSVSFTVTWKESESATDEGVKTANFTGSLSYQTESENKWKEGYSYNYIATINPKNVDPSLEAREIKFQVDAVEGWTDVDDELAPVKQ